MLEKSSTIAFWDRNTSFFKQKQNRKEKVFTVKMLEIEGSKISLKLQSVRLNLTHTLKGDFKC